MHPWLLCNPKDDGAFFIKRKVYAYGYPKAHQNFESFSSEHVASVKLIPPPSCAVYPTGRLAPGICFLLDITSKEHWEEIGEGCEMSRTHALLVLL